MKSSIIAMALAVVVFSSVVAEAQTEKPWVVEGLVGVAVPTFDVTDLVKSGFVWGVAGGYHINDKLMVLGEFDWGTHGPKTDGGPDVAVYHYMAKAGYEVYQNQDGKLRIFVNAGAGALTFDADVEGATSNTYFAINAGAKIYYSINDVLSIVLSPQGDIAFTSEDDGFTGSTAWVWPFTAGVALSF